MPKGGKKVSNITDESTIGEEATQEEEGSPGQEDKNYPPLTDAEKNAAAKEWLVQKSLLMKTTATKETRTKCWDAIYLAAKRFHLIVTIVQGYLLIHIRCSSLPFDFHLIIWDILSILQC